MENFELELEKYLSNQKTEIIKGSVVTGTIVKIDGNIAFVDIGMKSEAALPIDEENLEEGQEIRAVFTGKRNKEGYFLLSRKPLLFKERLDAVKLAYEKGEKLKGRVINVLEKGYIVDINGVRAFMLISIDESRKIPSVIVSRKKVLLEEREREKEKILSLLEEGRTVKAKIKKITERGLVLSIDNLVSGFLPVALLSWKKDIKPSDFEEGDELEVVVKEFDKETGKVIFSKRDLEPNPWVEFENDVGDVVEAKVKEINDFGLIVKVSDLEGFIHKLETDHLEPENYKRKFKVGDNIKAQIIELDRENRRLKLSIKRTQPNPLEEFIRENPEGSVIDAKVKDIKNKLAVLDLGRIEGILHLEDATWNPKIKNISHILKGKKHLKVKVLGIEGRRIRVGLKQFREDPWKEFLQNYKRGDNVEVTVKKLINRGAFVDIIEDLEGFIPLNEISKKKIKIPSDVLSLHQKVTAKIISIDRKNKSITLSIKAVEREKEKREIEEVIKKVKPKGEGLATLGEILKEKLNKE